MFQPYEPSTNSSRFSSNTNKKDIKLESKSHTSLKVEEFSFKFTILDSKEILTKENFLNQQIKNQNREIILTNKPDTFESLRELICSKITNISNPDIKSNYIRSQLYVLYIHKNKTFVPLKFWGSYPISSQEYSFPQENSLNDFLKMENVVILPKARYF